MKTLPTGLVLNVAIRVGDTRQALLHRYRDVQFSLPLSESWHLRIKTSWVSCALLGLYE